MKSQLLKTCIAVPLLMSSVAITYSQPAVGARDFISESEASVLQNLPHWSFTTRAYQEEIVRIMLKEANRVAAKLPLHEHLPITRSNIVESHIGPPSLVSLGWISTKDYVYVVGWGRKFSGLDQRNMAVAIPAERAKYKWSLSQMDTNRAFQIATQLMSAVDFDVERLNRDCAVEITSSNREGGSAEQHFFPDYWVIWRKSEKTVAFIQFLEPTKSIHQLHVYDPTYILREPIRITNLSSLLGQTNAPPRP